VKQSLVSLDAQRAILLSRKRSLIPIHGIFWTDYFACTSFNTVFELRIKLLFLDSKIARWASRLTGLCFTHF
ncbi:MAG: hypothetical protein ACFFD6_05225, partial [Candidatus Thorarchaeota archaeon]